jgi:hypothetical protein
MVATVGAHVQNKATGEYTMSKKRMSVKQLKEAMGYEDEDQRRHSGNPDKATKEEALASVYHLLGLTRQLAEAADDEYSCAIAALIVTCEDILQTDVA